MKEDRAHAAVALSAPASPAINPPVRVRRSGRCVGARWILRVLPAGCHVHMHTRTRAITHDLLLAHHSLGEHEKIGRGWTWSNE